ncbi:GntR family transcriptional regulator, histidine utilization repressor [Roseateles sp. YR242]|uniref:histidine utilization repressor n=1 Tax=Roseateles sp. YR242 TaxID=1855305 RepID=UPI0008C39442|nr:histidine utilization repressor [Roseateles sp. YR242]SEK50744.1 GntR family transcriptional regulator, histidine utilization repressor [Roseateles sp. YR242]
MVTPSGPAPQYLKVKTHLREGIASGRWRPGERLPSESELTQAFGVSRMTVNRALRELHQEGMVVRVQGVGSFVAELNRIASTLTVRDVHDEIAARGHRHEASVHVLETVKATAEQALQFQLKPGARLFHSVIVHRENGVAIQCEDRLVNPACAPAYMAQDFERVTPTHYLLEVAPLSEARYTIEAEMPNLLEARLLGMPRGEPCLVVKRCTLSVGQVVTAVRLVHPGSRWFLQGSFQA